MRHWKLAVAAVIVAVIVAADVSLILKKQHTKVVTKTVTRTVAAPAPKFDGSLSSLVQFLQPKRAQGTKCPPGFPPDAKCFVFASDRWYVDAALPADAAAS